MKANERGRFLRFFILGLLVLQALFLSNDVFAQPADKYWVQLQGDAQHTGRSQYRGPGSDVYAKWTFPVHLRDSSPSIGPDKSIYTMDVNNGTLYAINPDGTEKWKLFLGTTFWGVPAIDADGSIYVAGVYDGKLYAVSNSGALLWTFQTGYGGLLGGSPTIGDRGTIYLANSSGYIYALSTDGNLIWQKYIGNYCRLGRTSVAVGKNGDIYVIGVYGPSGGTKPFFISLDSTTGNIKWMIDIGRGNGSTPSVGDDGTIYIAAVTKGEYWWRYYAINPLGEILWNYQSHVPEVGTTFVALSHDNKAIYLLDQNRLVKLDAKTGLEIWRYNLGSYAYIYASTPVVGADGAIYFGTGNGGSSIENSIFAIDLNGKLLWKYKTDGIIFNTVAIGPDKTLYGGSDKLYALVEIKPANHPPLANAGPDQTVSCAGANGAAVMLDGSGSSDPDNDALTYTWTGVFGIAAGVNPVVQIPLGTYTVTLKSDDGKGGTAEDTVTITVQDSVPPSTSATITGTSGNNGWYKSDVNVSLTSTDNCSGLKEIHYTLDGAETIISGSSAGFTISAEGEHSLSFWAVDNANNLETAHTSTINIDKTAPVLNVTVNPGLLWPPNHKMVNITPLINVSDNLTSNVQVELVSVTSSEPDNGLGDGDTANDIVVNADGTISLRAERSGTGNGRVYTITYKATDLAGNITVASATVVVPHDMGKK